MTSSLEQTTLKTLLTNVSLETLSVPAHSSFAESRVIVEPTIPLGITTLKFVPSYAKEPDIPVVIIALSENVGIVDVHAIVSFELMYAKPFANPVLPEQVVVLTDDEESEDALGVPHVTPKSPLESTVSAITT